MAIGILQAINNQKARLEFKTQSGIRMGFAMNRPDWADDENIYAVLLSVKEQDDCISDLNILTYMEVY